MSLSLPTFAAKLGVFVKNEIDSVLIVLANKYGFDVEQAKQLLDSSYYGDGIPVFAPTSRPTKSKKTATPPSPSPPNPPLTDPSTSNPSTSNAASSSVVIDTIMDDSELNAFATILNNDLDTNDDCKDHSDNKPRKKAKTMTPQEKQAALDAKEKLKLEKEETKAKEKADKEAAKLAAKTLLNTQKQKPKTKTTPTSNKDAKSPRIQMGSKPVQTSSEIDSLASMSDSVAAFVAVPTKLPHPVPTSDLEPEIKKVSRITIDGVKYLITLDHHLYFEETKEDAYLSYDPLTKTTSFAGAEEMEQEDYVSQSEYIIHSQPKYDVEF